MENPPADVTESRRRSRGNYSHERAFYAEKFGATVRTVGNWIRQGAEAGEFPPLDDAEAMVAWWEKHMTHRVPEKILLAAGSSPRHAVPAAAPAPAAPPLPPDDLFARPPAAHSSGETGFLASLERTREAERDAHDRYIAALNEVEPDSGKIRATQRDWQTLAEHLRALEKSAPDLLRKSGDMWKGSEIIRELGEIMAPIVDGTRALGRRWAVRSSIEWDVAKDRAFQEEVDRLFSALLASKFTANE